MKLPIKSLCILSLVTLTLLSGCSDKEKTKSLTEGGMKCGAGKCGSSMANGSALLVKKKMNIIDQMAKDDKRRDCVLKSTTTKALYACVRNVKTGKLSTKCSSEDTHKKVAPKKETSTAKCEAGKCSSDMQQ